MKKGILILSSILFVGAFAVLVGRNDPNLADPVKTEAATSPSESYNISVAATAVSAYEVSLDVTTNIPVPIEVMASVSIKDQDPQDTYIGVSQRVTLTSSEQTVEIDGRNERLPTGEYVAEVTFYPRWGAENGSSEAKLIEEEIIGQADVSLTGSGVGKSQTDAQNVAQKWVMLNVDIGMSWNESQFVEKLGPFSKTESDLNLHDAYYFEEADMTIIVNSLKNTVTIWRMGQATK